jgi:hypothetical protein
MPTHVGDASAVCCLLAGRHSPESGTGCVRRSGPWGFKSGLDCGTVTAIIDRLGLAARAAHRPPRQLPKPVTGSERRACRPSHEVAQIAECCTAKATGDALGCRAVWRQLTGTWSELAAGWREASLQRLNG